MNYRRIVKLVAGAAVASLLTIGGGSAAFADGSPTVVLTGGTLTITSPVPGNFSGVTLNGTAQSSTSSVPTFSAVDARGTGVGWNITVGATQFCEQLSGSTCVASSPKTVPTGSLNLSAPSVSAGTGSGTVPTMTALTGFDGSSAKLASAAVANGMGTYNFGTSTLTLAIPANTYAKTYVSTITYTIATGP
jgi:hypothetical protein